MTKSVEHSRVNAELAGYHVADVVCIVEIAGLVHLLQRLCDVVALYYPLC